LELLRLSANALDRLPGWLWELPRLSWLAVAGNPASPAQLRGEAAGIPWDALSLAEVLGEGASGVISRGRHHDSDVAVKVFKGRVTSDGWPHDEMTACLGAGRHPNLVGVRGRVQGHPEGREALLLDLVPPGYANLGGPPSRESCTRDVFEPGQNLSSRSVRSVAAGIGSLLSHLHGRGIAHGDLYTHNILFDGEDHALLGDFGAASFLTGLASHEQDGFRRIEARAYGCLLDDLLGLAAQEPGLRDLAHLRDRCLSEIPSERPTTEELGGISPAPGA
jgi:serine/threonine protein kinase